MAVIISFQNVDFSTTLKAVLTAGYGIGIGGLTAYCGELVNTEVNFYISDTFLMYDSHLKTNVIFFFSWVNIINDSSSCPCK